MADKTRTPLMDRTDKGNASKRELDHDKRTFPLVHAQQQRLSKLVHSLDDGQIPKDMGTQVRAIEHEGPAVQQERIRHERKQTDAMAEQTDAMAVLTDAVAELRREMGQMKADQSTERSKMDKMRTDLSTERSEMRKMQTDLLIAADPKIIMGKCNLRDAFCKKVMTRLDAVSKQQLETLAQANAIQKKVKHSGQAVDTWTNRFTTKEAWQKTMDSIGLHRFGSYYGFIKDTSMRDRRNEAAHEDYDVFARAVVRAAELERQDVQEFMGYYEGMFKYTYDKTWDDAAKEAEARIGRS